MKQLKTLLFNCTRDFFPGTVSGGFTTLSGGSGRFGLTALILLVIAINLPFILRYYMVGHDTKQILGIFDYFYSNWVYAGELPRWMAYGLQGLDATPFYVAFMSASNYLAIFAGKIFGATDSLALFSVAACCEQLLFLLGLYLLSIRLFQEKISVFCICLTGALTIEWQFQIFFNLRLFCLLPLEFYLVLRFAESRTGWLGWLAGMMAVIGPTGSTYSYMFWALVLTAYSLAVLWGRFSVLGCMLKPNVPNILGMTCFLVLAGLFYGIVHQCLDGFVYTSPGRETGGGVDIATFLTYGGNKLSDLLESLYSPPKFMANIGGNAGMADYIGLVGIFCLPWALPAIRENRAAWPFAVTGVLMVALSLGGLLACAIYWLPGMNMFRHIGFLAGAIKINIIILSGFGLDRLINSIRNGTLLPRPDISSLLLLLLCVWLFVDLNLNSSNLAGVIESASKGSIEFFNQLNEVAIYPIARGVLLSLLVWQIWNACRSTFRGTPAGSDFPLTLLVICVLGDCLLFQSQLYNHQYKAKEKIELPAVKLDWPQDSTNTVEVNSEKYFYDLNVVTKHLPFDQLKTDIRRKFQTWSSAFGAEYQATVSSILQWNPAVPLFRTDWLPKNITELRNSIGKTNKLVLLGLPGFDGTNFRIIADSNAIYVNTDTKAVDLLKRQTNWQEKVIITGLEQTTPPYNGVSTNRCYKMDKLDFSANSFSLSVSNGYTQPIWLIHSDAYSPNWNVYINGKGVPLVKAYCAYQAVQLQPGPNLIQFHYPNNIRSTCLLGFAIVASLLVAAGLVMLIGLAIKELIGR